MGSPAHSAKQLLHTLELEPDLITWSAERNTTLWKDVHGKLGFRAKTFQGNKETYTVILKVKDECNISAGHLKRFDRITSINAFRIIHESEQKVLQILAALKNSEIALTVCRPLKFKIPAFSHIDSKASNSKLEGEKYSLNVNVSDRSISFNSWNSTGTESFELDKLSGDISERQNTELTEETCLDKEVRHKHTHKTDEGLTVNVKGRPEGLHKVSETVSDKGTPKLLHRSCDNPNLRADRTHSDACATAPSSESVDFKLKRGISQVSGSGSNKSQNSFHIESTMRRREKSMKQKDHKNTKFVKTGSIENTDEEIEPLHPEELTSPPAAGKLDKYSHFNVDDRSCSMPTTVSVADIVVEDPTLSLPLGLGNVAMNHGHGATCQCSMCTPGSDQRVCSKCALKTKPGSRSSTPTTDSQSVPLPEEHGQMILQNPQYAVWDGKNTHVVEIDKGQSKGFGFSYKVKVGKNQDASVEIYTLVDSVDMEGPSRDKLHIGDWVRSVNGTPIQVPQDAFNLLNNNSKEKTRRLVIQRPIRLSQSQQNLQVERDKTIPELNPPSPQSPCGSKDQDPLIPGTIAPKKQQDKALVPPTIYVIDSSHVDSCSKTVLPPFPKSVKLPKVRVFVCGSEAEKCINFLVKDSVLEMDVQNQCYSFISCSMSTDCFGNILVSHPCSNLFSASTTSPRLINQSDHRGGGDTKCKQCGGEVTSLVDGQTHGGQGNIVNVELYAVPDDRFFHFCCSYLFTKSSIFILTFDGSKLLRSAAGEFSRLQNLSHTVRSMAGEDSHIISCGFIEGGADSSNTMDEVRALFYTPLNSVLQNFHVFGPELVSTHTPNSTSDSLDENQLLQVLWKVVTETVQRQQVLQPSLLLIDHLVSLREKGAILTESQLMEIIQGKLPNYQVDVHQMILTYLIGNREILLGKASSFINSTFHRQIESLIMTDPQSLLMCLQKIITMVTEDKQNWLKMHSTGFTKTSSFLELCADVDKNNQFLADFMECNGIILRKPNSPNSGNTAEYFFPYFSVTPSTADRTVIENHEFELYLKFVDNESSQIYFALLFTLAAHCDGPSSFNVQDVRTCVFQYKGYHAVTSHQKIHDRVHFIFKREDKMASARPVDLFSWLKDICNIVLDSLGVSFILGAPCPRGENCSRTTTSSIHVIDLREKKPQFCDQERIDIMKPIRKWKQKDIPVQEKMFTLGTRSTEPTKQPVSVLELPHSVLHNVCARLRIPSELGRDWKGLAGLMGYTLEEVRMMETVKDPVRVLLYDWSTNNGKIDDLVKLLDELNMENVLCYLRQALPQNNLNSLSSPTATQNSMVSFQTSSSQNSEFSENSGLSGQVLYQRSKVTETEVMPLHDEGQGHTVRLNNLDGNNQMDTIGSSNQAITPVETVMDLNRILKS